MSLQKFHEALRVGGHGDIVEHAIDRIFGVGQCEKAGKFCICETVVRTGRSMEAVVLKFEGKSGRGSKRVNHVD